MLSYLPIVDLSSSSLSDPPSALAKNNLASALDLTLFFCKAFSMFSSSMPLITSGLLLSWAIKLLVSVAFLALLIASLNFLRLNMLAFLLAAPVSAAVCRPEFKRPLAFALPAIPNLVLSLPLRVAMSSL